MELVYTHNVEKFAADNIDGLISNYAAINDNYLERDYNEYVINRINEYEKNSADLIDIAIDAQRQGDAMRDGKSRHLPQQRRKANTQ